jgi:hypothetical protein
VQNLKDRRFDLYNVTWKETPPETAAPGLDEAAE